MILLSGKGWPGMAHGRMHGAALAAALAVVACQRARDCPRALAVFAGPSWRGPELAGMPRPAAEGAADGQPPALSGPGAVTGMTAFPAARDSLQTRWRGRSPPGIPRAPEGGVGSCACSGSENAGRCQVTDRGAESPIVTLRGGSPTMRAIVSDRRIARAASAGGRARRGALPDDTTRKGEFAMRDTWT